MKYILTENKIYETSKLQQCNDKNFINVFRDCDGHILIAQKGADTIEKLCIGYKVIFKDANDEIREDIFWEKKFEDVKLYYKNTLAIYGIAKAEDQDGILKFFPAAKMNEQGGLKLL